MPKKQKTMTQNPPSAALSNLLGKATRRPEIYTEDLYRAILADYFPLRDSYTVEQGVPGDRNGHNGKVEYPTLHVVDRSENLCVIVLSVHIYAERSQQPFIQYCENTRRYNGFKGEYIDILHVWGAEVESCRYFFSNTPQLVDLMGSLTFDSLDFDLNLAQDRDLFDAEIMNLWSS
ncbi:hypothetical protein EG328_004456 [Venturia inaequalis]|uniref:Uncharacterized protein n=1 Tax=Venturia inaequalis TaxID=5025 RepID=A0A8H3YXH1_VENIN|nr:hypothetical protein EG328_004456 [Venturia inaequalis]RDI85513.1 hypothetical protein Vi05172_g4403 [Venturia inaequalis]